MTSRSREAYVFWNGGVCNVISYPDQRKVCSSRHFRRATRRARNLGYDVRVYCSEYSTAPRDGIRETGGSYVLPRVPRRRPDRKEASR